MKRRFVKTAAVCAGFVIGLSACGQSGERKDAAPDSSLETENIETENTETGNMESEDTETDIIDDDSTETESTEMNEADANSAQTGETEESEWYQQMLESSVLSTGTNGRLEKVLEKMKNGESVSIAFIGGSVTEGSLAASYEESYTDCFVEGLQETYPDAEITYINAGLSGTGSSLGVMRYDRDVVEMAGCQPDIVFLEFAINDYAEPTDGRAYESMIRTILGADNDPAVILLFSVAQNDWNMQETYIPMGEHYGLPMVSIKNAIEKPLVDETLTKKEFFADEYHPSTYGHKIMADCLGELVREAESTESSEVAVLPEESVKSPDFMDMHLLTSEGEAGVTVSEGGFSSTDNQVHGFGRRGGKSAFPDNWMHTAESGEEAFRVELECKNIIVNYKTSASKDFGKVYVYVDGDQVAELDGDVQNAWNNSIQALVLDEEESGHHVLELRMAEGDEGKNFTLLAIGYSK